MKALSHMQSASPDSCNRRRERWKNCLSIFTTFSIRTGGLSPKRNRWQKRCVSSGLIRGETRDCRGKTCKADGSALRKKNRTKKLRRLFFGRSMGTADNLEELNCRLVGGRFRFCEADCGRGVWEVDSGFPPSWVFSSNGASAVQ